MCFIGMFHISEITMLMAFSIILDKTTNLTCLWFTSMFEINVLFFLIVYLLIELINCSRQYISIRHNSVFVATFTAYLRKEKFRRIFRVYIFFL